LGDIVLMTAAVRDLHKCYPGAFRTDVRTTCGQVWNYNPYLEHLDQNDPEIEIVPCEPRLTNWSNTVPYHIIESFIDDINERLGLHIRCTDFKGDLHFSPGEKRASPVIHRLAGRSIPYWLIFAGGRHEIPIKWWDSQRYQQVVDHFAGKIQFVQAGGVTDYHPKLRGTIDLRGKTTLRGLMQLVYHSDGVLCGVTGPMHLAASVRLKKKSAGLRPCVVVAGAREPPHWASYPGHQFIHNVGALPCCASGGCWKRRVFPLGDGTAQDAPHEMCVDVRNGLPHCMDLITADDVISRVEIFLRAGRVRALTSAQALTGNRAVKLTLENSLDDHPLRLEEARYAVEALLRSVPAYPAKDFKGSGIVVPALSLSDAINAWLLVKRLRELGCALPVELWYWGAMCLNPALKGFLDSLDVTSVDTFEHKKQTATNIIKGPQLKPYILKHSRFSQILMLSPELRALRNPDYLLKAKSLKGALCWPQTPHKLKPDAWHLCALDPSTENPVQSGVMLLDKKASWTALSLWLWYCQQSHIYHLQLHCSEDAAHMAFRKTNVPLGICGLGSNGELKDQSGKMLFRWTNGVGDFPPMNGQGNHHNRDWLDLEALRAAHRAEAGIQPSLARSRL
jgi:ADP-heptose:LPS heptosyltransferase